MSPCCSIWKFVRLLLLLSVGLEQMAPAQSLAPAPIPRKDFWDVDGTIHSVIATNGKIYVGGAFSYVGPKGSKLISLDPFTGSSEQGFPAIYGKGIYSILEDGNGGWFIGGEFHLVGNAPRTNLVHILNDNTVDPEFQPNPNGSVRTLALAEGRLYVGGEFSWFAGQPRSHLAAWHVGSQSLTAWAPAANGTVSALHVSGSVVYAGGYFTQLAGQSRRNIGAVDGISGGVLPWSPQADGAVLAMAMEDQKLYVGGLFNRIGGELRNGLAALSVESTNALAWNPNPAGGKVTSLQVMCNTVFVGGYFTNLAGAPRHRVGAVDAQSGQALAWDAKLELNYSANSPSEVLALRVAGERVYVGGQFVVETDGARRDLAAFDAATGQLLSWAPELNGGVSALGLAGRRVLAGLLRTPGGVERHNLAAFDESTGTVLPFSPVADGPVYALALKDGALFAGGSFTNINGHACTRLVALNAESGEVLTNWNASANNTVFALKANGSTLYAGGSFTTLNGLGRLRLGALDSSTGQALPGWTAHTDGAVYALEALGPNLYAGGSFISIAGFARLRLAALSLANGAVQSWSPNANQTVFALCSDGTTIYAGGRFTAVSGQFRSRMAAMDPLSGTLTGWGPSLDDEVRAISISGDHIFIGGIFLHAEGLPRFGLAALTREGTLLEWNPATSSNNRIYASAVSERALYAGGEPPLAFDSGDSHALAAFPPQGFPSIAQGPFDAETASGKAFNLSVSANGEAPLSYSWTFNGVPLSSSGPGYSAVAQPGDSGVYEVSVSNRLGVAKARATVTVLEAVSILSHPISQLATNGVDVTLSVSATGNPPPLYQWRLNGANLPGAVFPTLTLTNVSATSGGSYYAVVGNRMGAINSEVAEVTVASPSLPFSDDFASRGSVTGESGSGTANNSAATLQSGEPRHAGKFGGKSLWLKWTAPTNGIATFSTRGSAFDTLLAVYTGSSLTNLTRVNSDEDSGGFLTSQLHFNAEAGAQYQIAVDGLAGAGGTVVLNWNLDTSAGELPRIIRQPLSQSVLPGGQATLDVEVSSSTPLSYQWFFGCREIQGATNSSLTISNVGLHQVGRYRVFVMNHSSRLAESLPAALEMSSTPGVLSADKLEDLLEPQMAGTNSFRAGPKAGLAGHLSPLLVSMGTIAFQTFDTTAATSSLRETNHCGIIGGVSMGIRFQPAQDGTVLVDTIGSPFDTVLAIYRNTNFIVLATNPAAAFVTCEEDGAPDGIRSRLKFKAKANEIYLAVVDGVLGAEGTATLHWQLGTAPTIVRGASNVTATFGSQVVLGSGTASTTLSTSYQWFLNGVRIPGATNAALSLTNLHPWQAGVYSVIASNFAGQVMNNAAHLQVDVPLHLDRAVRWEDSQFRAQVWANSNQSFVLEGSEDLQSWLALLTNTVRTNPLPVIDAKAGQFPKRFYRVVPYP